MLGANALNNKNIISTKATIIIIMIFVNYMIIITKCGCIKYRIEDAELLENLSLIKNLMSD
jgi:hypothetical protein